ncbi:hypothetical protein ACIGO9_20605 [Nocardia asteroides]|uniref:hypothetical protein n=1 Tax=Nocardia asteroides TaxID=1824 RepID=UPI0037CB1583
MITNPSSSQLLRLVRAGLQAHVAPAVTEPAAAAALGQAGLVLGFLEAVVDSEAAWLRQEIADIHASAQKIVDLGADSQGQVAKALAVSRRASSDSTDLAAIRQEYDSASETLSLCLEITLPRGGAVHDIALAALRRRIERETALRAAGGLGYTSRVTTETEDK